MGGANFWENQEKAQKYVSELRQLTAVSKPLRELIASGEDLKVLMEFADEDKSGASLEELIEARDALGKRLDEMELKAMLSGPNDHAGAYVSIQAGEGGTDASDWAAMLLRMYQRWAEIKGFECEELELSEA